VVVFSSSFDCSAERPIVREGRRWRFLRRFLAHLASPPAGLRGEYTSNKLRLAD
jgi:hypothetical protein